MLVFRDYEPEVRMLVFQDYALNDGLYLYTGLWESGMAACDFGLFSLYRIPIVLRDFRNPEWRI